MKYDHNIEQVEQLPVQMMGFIFYPRSPRYVEEVPSYLPKLVKRVGVFVNEDLPTISSRVEQFGLHMVQLHGNEPTSMCAALRLKGFKVIKAFHIESSQQLEQVSPYESCCDYFLFDTPSKSYGGTGKSFDWDVLQHYRGEVPFLLSGGIGVDSLDMLHSYNHPLCVGIDLNSRFEISPGLKDVSLLSEFLSRLY